MARPGRGGGGSVINGATRLVYTVWCLNSEAKCNIVSLVQHNKVWLGSRCYRLVYRTYRAYLYSYLIPKFLLVQDWPEVVLSYYQQGVPNGHATLYTTLKCHTAQCSDITIPMEPTYTLEHNQFVDLQICQLTGPQSSVSPYITWK